MALVGADCRPEVKSAARSRQTVLRQTSLAPAASRARLVSQASPALARLARPGPSRPSLAWSLAQPAASRTLQPRLGQYSVRSAATNPTGWNRLEAGNQG